MQNSQRGFSGVWIPKQILDSTELTPSEKIIYANIVSFDKCCFETNERLAEKCGVDEKTVRRALTKLQELKFVFIEFINNNKSKRRIYAIQENPKKLEYLAKKGLFHSQESEDNREEKASFPQTGQNVQSIGQNVRTQDAKNEVTGQNVLSIGQNVQSANRGETGQNVQQRINKKKEEKETPEQEPNFEDTSGVVAVEGPRRPDYSQPPRRSDYEDAEEFERAYYAWRSAT